MASTHPKTLIFMALVFLIVGTTVWALVVTLGWQDKKIVVVADSTPIIKNRPHLQIYHVNDIYQLAAEGNSKRGGISAFAKLVEDARAENPNTFVTVSGDILSGSMESTFFKGAQMVDALNKLNVTAATVGNRDLDWGLDVLNMRVRESKFKWVSSNLNVAGSPINGTVSYFSLTVPEVPAAKICFFGTLFNYSLSGFAVDPTLTFSNQFTIATAISAQMKTNLSCTVVIALTHQYRDEDCAMIGGTKNIDLILGGHDQEASMSTNCGSGVYQKSSSNFRNVWKLEIDLDSKGKLSAVNRTLIPVDATLTSNTMDEAVSAWTSQLSPSLQTVIGTTSVPLDQFTWQTRTKETPLGNFLADSLAGVANSKIVILSSQDIRGDTQTPPGPITRAQVANWLSLEDPIVRFTLTGSQLRTLITWAVGLLNFQTNRFPQISGFKFQFSISPDNFVNVSSVSYADESPVLDSDVIPCLSTSSFVSTLPIGVANVTQVGNRENFLSAVEAAFNAAPGKVISPRIEGRIVQTYLS